MKNMYYQIPVMTFTVWFSSSKDSHTYNHVLELFNNYQIKFVQSLVPTVPQSSRNCMYLDMALSSIASGSLQTASANSCDTVNWLSEAWFTSYVTEASLHVDMWLCSTRVPLSRSGLLAEKPANRYTDNTNIYNPT